MKNKILKNILIIGACMLACIFVCCLIGFVSKGTFDFTKADEWGLRSVNEENLLKVEEYVIDDLNTGLGYSIDVTDQGQIKISGTNDSGENQQIKVQDVTLKAGTYKITSGVSGTSLAGYNMCIVVGENTYYADFGADTEFTIETDTTATVYINLADKVEINKTFSPVVIDTEAENQSFFVIG